MENAGRGVEELLAVDSLRDTDPRWWQPFQDAAESADTIVCLAL